MVDRNTYIYCDKFCDRKCTVLREHIGRAPDLTVRVRFPEEVMLTLRPETWFIQVKLKG